MTAFIWFNAVARVLFVIWIGVVVLVALLVFGVELGMCFLCCFMWLAGLFGCRYVKFGVLCLVCFYVVGCLFAGICRWFLCIIEGLVLGVLVVAAGWLLLFVLFDLLFVVFVLIVFTLLFVDFI